MTAELDAITLPIIAAHANTFNLQASVAGVVQPLATKTITATLKYYASGNFTNLALTIGSGITITDVAAGKFALALTLAQVNAIDVDKAAYCYLTVWNADDSAWAWGKFPLMKVLG